MRAQLFLKPELRGKIPGAALVKVVPFQYLALCSSSIALWYPVHLGYRVSCINDICIMKLVASVSLWQDVMSPVTLLVYSIVEFCRNKEWKNFWVLICGPINELSVNNKSVQKHSNLLLPRRTPDFACLTTNCPGILPSRK